MSGTRSTSAVDASRPTRERMLDSAVALLRERSSAGVTIDAVLAHSGAPRGSVYHHFPGGREQLVREAVQRSGRSIARLIAASEGPPSQVATRFVEFWEQMLHHSDYLAGCPVVALTVDAGDVEQPLVHEIFSLWEERLVEVFVRGGIPAARAARLATLAVSAAEGAIVLCRAQQSAAPLHAVGAELRLLLESAAVDAAD